ncbi:HNH endonuclease family protein [Streptomyces sp. YIM 98790]|uniref:HNH endonuclease family protein n=1 Tax=Streptomyces sp. YIM 98790 TaxID=2689077 RepID=UPI00140AF149
MSGAGITAGTGTGARKRSLLLALPAVLATAAMLLFLLSPPASAAPPRIPSLSTAQYELGRLTVAAEGSTAGYSRDLFPHWRSSGGCTARQTVLKRDGSNVVVNSNCQPTSGTWYSQYDGVTLSAAGDVDIDHVIPLAEAWRSGASSWTTSKRGDFANDLYWPQLIAVSAGSNRSKGDQDPADWQPRTAYRCTYAKMWIHVKYHWNLKVDSAEKSALQSMLNTYC